jgi:hypothetical protein
MKWVHKTNDAFRKAKSNKLKRCSMQNSSDTLNRHGARARSSVAGTRIDDPLKKKTGKKGKRSRKDANDGP